MSASTHGACPARYKFLAIAVASLLANAAFGQTEVKIGGKYDAGYQFKHTANKDTAAGGYGGYKTTETLGDGGASTSRITVQAKEDLGRGWAAMVDLDLRFGTIEEGKNATTDGSGGLNSNDKKALYLTSPFGNLRWGVMNFVSQQYWDYEEKPYMVNVKDLEIVKYGVYAKRFTSLTNRNTEYDTPILTIGPFQTRLKGNYAIGNNQKSGANDADNVNSGNAYSVANTGAVGKWVNWTLSAGHRTSTTNAAATRNGLNWQEHQLNVHPMPGLKLGASYAVAKGYGDTATSSLGIANYGSFKEKNTNFVIAYNFGSKAQIGIERSHLNDLSSSRNSGKGFMVGGSYHISKSVYVYAAYQKDDFARNDTLASTGGYDGTKTGFIGSFTKADMKYTRFGIVKEF